MTDAVASGRSYALTKGAVMGWGPSPAFNVGGIACAIELVDGITVGDSGGRPEAIVKFKCDYEYRLDLYQKLRGEVFWFPPSGYLRMPGYPYPEDPSLICLDVSSIRGIGPTRTDVFGWLHYESAVVTARFGVPEYDPVEFWSLREETSGEFVTYPGTNWMYIGGGIVDAEQSRPMPHKQISYSTHRLPFIPSAITATLQDTVNLNPYRIGNVVYDAGVLLFLGNSTESRRTLVGLEHDISYQIAYRRVPWNYVWNPASFSWQEVSSDGTAGGVRPFETADWSILPV